VELGKALTSELRSERLFSGILQKVSELLPAEHWSLLLIDESTGELRFELSVNLDLEVLEGIRLAPGEGIAGKVALEQKPLYVENVRDCDFFFGEVDRITGSETTSVICVPLVFAGRTVGVIEVVNPRATKADALPLLSIIADYAAIAVENMRRYRKIQDLAIHDDLTGLYNTRYLYRALEEHVAEAQATGKPFSLVFMDIDNFKAVVDTYGHLKGSQTLREVGATIRACLPEEAFGVAYGGDEFVVVLKGFDREAARRKAEEIRAALSSARYLAGYGHSVSLAASLGTATFPDDAQDVRGLLALADHAMFEIKGTGKNGVKSA
jgi:diguanylate cyclase (GGDEF)-like protein